jgi:hypothetical protein
MATDDLELIDQQEAESESEKHSAQRENAVGAPVLGNESLNH